MDVVYHRASSGNADFLLVMLPGAGFAPDDFVEHGFIRAISDRGLAIDIAVACPGLDPYLDQTLVAELRREITAIGRLRTHRRLWFLGVSLGGLGALLYAQDHAAEIDGVILLAPFLGTPGLIAEVARAGGLASWEPGPIVPNDGERRLLSALKTRAAPEWPQLYLGYARGDRFVLGHRLLAKQLPAERVLIADGGHDWETWTRLWQDILDKEPFARGVAR